MPGKTGRFWVSSVPGVVLPVDDRAGGGEGVGAEGLRLPGHDVREPGQDLGARGRLDRVHGGVHGQPVGRLVCLGLELPDRQHRQVAGHGLRDVPVERRPSAGRPLLRQLPVGHGLQALGDGDMDVVRRLVGGVIVPGEPGHGPGGLAEREDPVLRGEPPLLGAVRVGDRHGLPGVPHDRAELGALPQRLRRTDRQLVPGPLERGLLPVDGDAFDGQALEVEVERAEVLGGLRGDVGGTCQPVPVGVEGERVVRGVVAAVAQLRKVRVPQPRGTRRAVHTGGTGAEGQDEGEDGGGGPWTGGTE